MKRALITGVAGQDGSYLAELLLEKGYEVHGVVRSRAHTENLSSIIDRLTLIEGDLLNATFCNDLVRTGFDELYNLASISTVQSPWEDPATTVASTGMVPLTFLEAIRLHAPHTRFFQSSSAEMYGDPAHAPQSETTPFVPRSPYGYGKLLAHEAVEGYRSQFGVFAVSGILFNHESPRRPTHFVTRKITSTLARIARGSDEVLELGNLDAVRDWSYAGDVIDGMWRALQHEKPESYVFASGKTHTVKAFVSAAADALSLPLTWHGEGKEVEGTGENGTVLVRVNPQFFRPIETVIRQGDITKARTLLQWEPATSFEELVRLMATAERPVQ